MLGVESGSCAPPHRRHAACLGQWDTGGGGPRKPKRQCNTDHFFFIFLIVIFIYPNPFGAVRIKFTIICTFLLSFLPSCIG